MGKLERLLALIDSSQVLGSVSFTGIDIDACLCERDRPYFDQSWIDAFRAVDGVFREIDFDKNKSDMIDIIRERAFKQTYNCTQNPQLSGYVSDDFELIAKAVLAAPCDPWANALWSEYKSGRFPSFEVSPVEGDLRLSV